MENRVARLKVNEHTAMTTSKARQVRAPVLGFPWKIIGTARISRYVPELYHSGCAGEERWDGGSVLKLR